MLLDPTLVGRPGTVAATARTEAAGLADLPLTVLGASIFHRPYETGAVFLVRVGAASPYRVAVLGDDELLLSDPPAAKGPKGS